VETVEIVDRGGDAPDAPGGPVSRIVVLTPWDRMWSLSGAGAPSWAYLIEGMLDAGHLVDVIAPAGETRDYPDHPRLRIHRMPPPRAAQGPLLRGRAWMSRTRRLVGAARAYGHAHGRPDLVYGFSALATPAAAICARGWRRPSVGKLFGTFLLPIVGHPGRLPETWDEALGFRAPVDRLVVHNDGTGGDVVARWLRVPPGRLRFWRNGVDRAACETAMRITDPRALRAELKLPGDAPMIYTASRLVRWKRVDRILRAMPGVLAAHPRAHLVIGGTGEETGHLEELAARVGVSGAVIFAGSIARDRNLQLMAAADVFCSTYDYSNLGNALQEAMSCRAPVVVTDTGYTSDLVHDGRSGLVVAPDDTAALSHALASVLGDRRLRDDLADGALRAATELLPTKAERIGWEVAMVERLIAGSAGRRP
jgi:glycosyltransferase involved in cell wall biosynthesis